MILRLKKKNNFWRMDKKTFFLFKRQIEPYTNIKDKVIAFYDIHYAEISNSDIQNIGLLYGYSLEDNDTLLLAEVFPKSEILLPSEKFFDINICGIINQTESTQKIRISRK